jgi:hypothetical protein
MIWWPILLIAAAIVIAVLLAAIAKRDRAGRIDDSEDGHFSRDEKADVMRKNSVFGASRDTYLNRRPYGHIAPGDIGDEESEARRR